MLILLIYFSVKHNSPFSFLTADERNLYIKAGVTSCIGMGTFYAALNISRIVVVAPFQNTSPIFILILSYFFLQRLEDITKILIFGSILVIAGAMLIGFLM
ncbi:hypothetical protein AKJ56_00215 [candidate division MSBL1 archaeon SCGC-AAA382N08]|uniref:EamA domain-containing protein n=1 Tax=candidate division MSBL1 archaeon SCGC-AAA382N08 TaxID=1698285 RepID=A0A133VQS4_9EURY|nr:hypothetical protein AKJ56_00215 [candidate division MSBL1 archaeon SCGC-AAA382N08]